MNKTAQHLMHGFMIGVMVGIAISLIFSFIFGEGNYAPLSPISTMGQIYHQHLTEPMIMLICVVIWGCIGILFTLAEVIYNHADWSMLKMTVVHFVLCYLGFLPLACLAGWFPLSIINFLVFTIIYIIVYLIIWMINYFKNKDLVNTINQNLK